MLPTELLKSQSGFTLLETMIAIAIMLVAFSSIMMVESGSLNTSAKAKQMNVVAMLAKNVMTETEYQLEGKTFEEVKEEDAGTFPEPYQDYRWKKTIKEIRFPQLNMGAVQQTDSAQSAEADSEGGSAIETMTKLITNYLSKAVRQVDVTVFWRRGSGEQSYSLSTYWVDLNHEFQLTE
jgi:prepilin-type N-terminal cleavage/methylation domain-containing protein